MRDTLTTELNKLCFKLRAGVLPIFRLDNGFHFLTKLFMRNTKHGDIHHFGMRHEQVLSFLGIDIYPA